MGRAAKYTQDQLQAAVVNSSSISGVMSALNLKRGGGSWGHIRQRLKHFGIDTSHFTGSAWAKGKPSNRKHPPEAILVVQDATAYKTRTEWLRRALLELGRPHCCAVCGRLPEWEGRPLTLQVDHINGDNRDHRQENLRFLCPNCHSQTSNYAGNANGRHPAG